MNSSDAQFSMAHLDTEALNIILQGCRKRERAAQHRLYKQFYPYGMSIAIRYVDNENEAISILNDAFMKVFKHIDRYDESQAFKPWFRRILVNTALNQIKKNRKYRLEIDMENAKEVADREEILSRISYQELIGLVQSLSLAYRTVFNMYVIDGYKHQEIAQKLGISESTSKSNLVRAREKLRSLLTEKLALKHV